MNKKIFRGWIDVFSFTFRQGMNEKYFNLATIGITVLLFVVGMSISVIMAFTQKKDTEKVSSIEVVHVIDESGLPKLYFDEFTDIHKEKYPNVSFEPAVGTVDEIGKQMGQHKQKGEKTKGTKDVLLHIGETDEGYQMTLYIPEYSVIKEEEGRDFLETATKAMEQSKLISSKIPTEKLLYVMSDIYATMLDAGEVKKSLGEELFIYAFPMFSVFVIFIMNIIYGQSIGRTASVEKTSKLMEMMLTMVRPESLIFGKIFATTCIAMLQMICWVVGLGAGFFLGDVLAGNVIYPQYNNALMELIHLMKEQNGSTAFSMGAFMIALLTICISLLFYCSLAGLIAGFAEKTEDLETVMSYYQMFLMIGIFVVIRYMVYIVETGEKEWLSTLLRIFPITSAYMLTGEVVVGNISAGDSILYVAILLAFTIVLTIITGKIYKNQLFYKGTGTKKNR